MARKRVKQSDFSHTLQSILGNYSYSVTRNMRLVVEAVADEMLERIRALAPDERGRGKYRRAMRVKVDRDDPLVFTKLWYVNPPYHRLTHLLEKGHPIVKEKGGAAVGHAKAYEHIGPGEKWAKQELMERLKEAVEDASK